MNNDKKMPLLCRLGLHRWPEGVKGLKSGSVMWAARCSRCGLGRGS